jgi:hypothetical protein
LASGLSLCRPKVWSGPGRAGQFVDNVGECNLIRHRSVELSALAVPSSTHKFSTKRAAAFYHPRRAEDWVKVKCLNRQEFVIGGWVRSDKPGRELRSLLPGYYDRGKLTFAGKAGTGFGLAAGRELAERLGKIERDTPPIASVPRAYQRDARWVEPRLARRWPSPPGSLTTSCAIRALKGCGKINPPGGSSSSGSVIKGADHCSSVPWLLRLSSELRPAGADIRQISLSWAQASAVFQFSVEIRWRSKASIAWSESLSIFSQ